MHLLNARTHQLETFLDDAKRPAYAILSHTWGDEEILYQDLKTSSLETFNLKKGYAKIRFTCVQALEDGLDYVWVDTCCIDKASSAELSEAINSMFNWYRDAKLCYAFLGDVEFLHVGLELLVGPQLTPATIMSIPEASLVRRLRPFVGSRWFQRGWTLQELLAPRRIVFYSRLWQNIGTLMDLETRQGIEHTLSIGRGGVTKRRSSTGQLDTRAPTHFRNHYQTGIGAMSMDDEIVAQRPSTRQLNTTTHHPSPRFDPSFGIVELSVDEWSLAVLISHATRIPVSVVAKRENFLHSSVAKRMSWAASRLTTRKEDEAYSLLGIFGVNMPLLYGEGSRAFDRLQREIANFANDHTLFAWSRRHDDRPFTVRSSNFHSTIMAPHLKCFYDCHYLNQKGPRTLIDLEHGWSHHGTKSGIEVTLPLHKSRLGVSPAIAALHCYDERWPSELIVLKLRPLYTTLLSGRGREFFIVTCTHLSERPRFSMQKILIKDPVILDDVVSCQRLHLRLNAASDLALHARILFPSYAWDAGTLSCIARPDTKTLFTMEITSSSKSTTGCTGYKSQESHQIYILVHFDHLAKPEYLCIGPYHGEDLAELSKINLYNSRYDDTWIHKLTDDMYVAAEFLFTSSFEPPVLVVNAAHGSASAAKIRGWLRLLAEVGIISVRHPLKSLKSSLLFLLRDLIYRRERGLQRERIFSRPPSSHNSDAEERWIMDSKIAKQRKRLVVRVRESLQLPSNALL